MALPSATIAIDTLNATSTIWDARPYTRLSVQVDIVVDSWTTANIRLSQSDDGIAWSDYAPALNIGTPSMVANIDVSGLSFVRFYVQVAEGAAGASATISPHADREQAPGTGNGTAAFGRYTGSQDVTVREDIDLAMPGAVWGPLDTRSWTNISAVFEQQSGSWTTAVLEVLTQEEDGEPFIPVPSPVEFTGLRVLADQSLYGKVRVLLRVKTAQAEPGVVTVSATLDKSQLWSPSILRPNTKGGILSFNSVTQEELAVGANGTILKADSTTQSGLAWTTPGALLDGTYVRRDGTTQLLAPWNAGDFLITNASLDLTSATTPLVLGSATAPTGNTTVQVTCGAVKTAVAVTHTTRFYLSGTAILQTNEMAVVCEKTTATTNTGTLSMKVNSSGTAVISNSAVSGTPTLTVVASGTLTLTSSGGSVSCSNNFLTNDIRGRTAVPLVIGSVTNTTVELAAAAIPTNILSNVVSFGPDSGTTDITLNFKAGTNDATIIFDESVPGFRSSYYWAVGPASGAPFSNTGALEAYINTGDNANYRAAYFGCTQNQTSSVTEYQGYGIQGQTTWSVGGTKGDATGCFFTTRINNVSSKGSTSCELVGAQFKVDCSGTTNSNTIGTLRAGYFRAVPVGDSNTYTSTQGLVVDVTIGGTNNAATSMYGLLLNTFNNAGAGNTLSAGYGIYLCDVTDMQAAVATLDAIFLDAQNGTASGATKGNLRFAGGNYNTGHVQLENGHVWNDATNNAIRLKGSAPASETDGVGILGTVVAAGANAATWTNGPWATATKNPDSWLEVYDGATRGVVPWFNLA